MIVKDEARIVLGALTRGGMATGGAAAGWRLELVQGGLNTRVYVAVNPIGQPRLTVRLARPDAPELLLHEERVLRELADTCRCAPTVIARIHDPTLPSGALLAHSYVPGAPQPLATLSSAARTALGGCLASVHSAQRDGYVIWPSREQQAGTRLDAFWARFASLDRYASARHSLLGERVAPLLQHLAASHHDGDGWEQRSFSLLHGDLSNGNILWDGDAVWLIDWEFARAGDPAEDLAYLVSEQPLDSQQTLELSSGYLAGGGQPGTLSRVATWLPLVAFDAALWWADYVLVNGEDPASHTEVLLRLARAEQFTEHP
jgi:aminoglycoside phosphotransferase (APT) family kinase protein